MTETGSDELLNALASNQQILAGFNSDMAKLAAEQQAVDAQSPEDDPGRDYEESA